MIEAKNVIKSFGKKVVINDITLNLNPNEITVLIGPSGSGKTTLLNILSLLMNPDKGTVNIDNKTYSFPSKNPITEQFKVINNHQKVGVVFQDLLLQPHWTNYQNIIFPLGRNITKQQLSKLDELISIFNMEKFIHNYPSKSSKGEEQRVAFCRAILLNPNYLFLDEITSSLDPEQIVSILKYCIKLKKEGKGLFIITHYIPFASRAADRVIFIDQGKIIEDGSTEILKSPKSIRLNTFINNLNSVIF